MSEVGKNNSLLLPGRACLIPVLALGVVFFGGCSSADEVPSATSAKPAAVESGHPVDRASAAHPLPVSRPFWTNFEINTSVHAVAFRDSDVWVGTEGGLLRYSLTEDAVVAKYDTSNGLFSNNVVSLDDAPDGGLWVGTHGGGLMHRSPEGVWTQHNVPELGDSFVYQTLADVNGNGYWVATWSGLSHFDGSHWRTYTIEDGLVDDWVYAMAQDKDGTLWLGTEGGVSVFADGRWTTYTHAEGLGASKEQVGDYEVIGNPSQHHRQTPGKSADGYNPNYVLSVLIDADGNKWFGTWGGGLSRFDGKNWTTFTRADGLGGNYVTGLSQDADGTLWATTDAGVSAYHGDGWRTFTMGDGLISDSVFAVAVDGDGRKWFSTMGGVSRLDGFAGADMAFSPGRV